jgi:rRNA maturation endonuclease Nob1
MVEMNKTIVLDTSYFIKLKPLNLLDGTVYLTTDFIIKEIRDEKVYTFNTGQRFLQFK